MSAATRYSPSNEPGSAAVICLPKIIEAFGPGG
jgi:hypothetical protein